MWTDLAERLKQEVNWSIYAKSYDRMLLNFDAYHQLIKKMVALLGDDSLAVLDLASGTGNVTIKMLQQTTDRTVWALEANEDMLEYMREKVYNLKEGENKKVNILKGDLLLSLREIDDNSFEGAIMMNALYAMPDRPRCLQEIFRVLKPGGTLVYSSSTTDTDVNRLFSAIRTNLKKNGCLDSMRAVVDSAYDRHVQMIDNIIKDSHQDVVNYAKHAGFCVNEADVEQGAYEGAVTIVKAVKMKINIGEVKEIIPPDQKVRVFISYAHENKEWCQRIKNYLNPLTQDDEIEVWTDQALEYGDDWRQTISDKLDQSTVAILLVSTPFLNSTFIKNNELPSLLHKARSNGLLIVPLILELCVFEHVSYKYPDPKNGPEEFKLSELQLAGSPTEPMSMLEKPKQNLVLHEIAKRILSMKQKQDN
jgi:ubiquinone/menaquinone biosynthesis C-methylase UbiE